MMKRNAMCAAVLIVWAFMGSATGQTAEDTEGDRKTGFRVSLFSQWTGPQLYYKGAKGEYFELKAFRMSYTKKLPFIQGQPVIFYTRKENEDQKIVFKPYLITNIPTNMIEPLLVLYWRDKEQKGYAQVLEFSPRRFRYGSYQIVNLGATPIIGYVASKTDAFQCLATKSSIKAPSSKDGAVIPIEMYTKIGNRTKVVYSASIKHRKGKRMIIFVFPHVGQNQKTVYRAQVLEDYAQD